MIPPRVRSRGDRAGAAGKRSRARALARNPTRTVPRSRARALARTATAPLILALALGGCGDRRAGHAPALGEVPLVPGARVVASVSQCDPGANAFCALQVVIRDARFRSSKDLLEAERRKLSQAHWASSYADSGLERAAESPTHRLRVTYATADGDLRAIDLGWVHRQRTITLALSHALLTQASALSLMLEAGSS